jgi:hypothetical protein
VDEEDGNESALDWHAPSPRLRVLRRYEVLAATVASLILVPGVTVALGAGLLAVVAVIALLAAGSICRAL